MKKEVEEKLIKLSEDFQTMMQSKIDSTTKITIIENSALRTEVSFGVFSTSCFVFLQFASNNTGWGESQYAQNLVSILKLLTLNFGGTDFCHTLYVRVQLRTK